MKKQPAIGLRYLWEEFLKIALSFLCAGIFYFVWLAAFLLSGKLHNPVVEIVGWLTAPLATASGFATGIKIFEYLSRARRTNFTCIFIWPLLGCAFGAGAVYPFGPMLIVFGMFAAGTASIILREIVLSRKAEAKGVCPRTTS